MRFEAKFEQNETGKSLWRLEGSEGSYYLGGIPRPGDYQADNSWAPASQSSGQTLVQRAVKGIGLIPRPLQPRDLGLPQQPPLEAYTQTLGGN